MAIAKSKAEALGSDEMLSRRIRQPGAPPARHAQVAVLLLPLLAGCNGGGGGAASGGGGGNTTWIPPASTNTDTLSAAYYPAPIATYTSIAGNTVPTGSNPFSVAYVTQFNDQAAAQYRDRPDFSAQKLTWTYNPATDGGIARSLAASTYTFNSFSYASAKFDYPLSHGLTGKDITVAVIDAGFRATHEKLAGKTVNVVDDGGTAAEKDHGTHVASIIAGPTGGAMMGLAPEASLHLSRWGVNAGDPAELATATDSARAAGAIVQNNSWGYQDGRGNDITYAMVNATPGANLVTKFGNATGYSSVATYLESLRAFIEGGSRGGVIVFALSNNASATSAVIPASLPAALKHSSDTAEQALGSKLAAGWIVAVNAVPNFDSNGKIISAVRLSSKCFEMADSCITGDGYTKGASSTGDAAYSYGTGTSFVAPQISAGIALLAQAFPSLPATDLRKRLLASANNTFYSNYVGTSDFGNGVTHKYNEEFGHGFLDMKAALLPIGAVGLPNTASAYGGVQPLSTSQIVTASAQGQAVSKSLAASNLTIFDSLGADFRVSAGTLSGGTRNDVDLARRFRRFTASAYNGTSAFGMPAFSSGGSVGGTDGWSFAFGRSDDVVASFGAAPSLADIGPSARTMQGLLPDSLSFGASTTTSPGSRMAVYAFGSLDQEQRSFVSGLPVDAPDRRKSFGAGFVQSMNVDTTTVSFGASVMGEPQSALGMTSSGALGTTRGLSAAFDFGVSQPVMEKTRLFATAQLGASLADANGLMRTEGRTAFSGFGLGVERTGVIRERDAVSFAVSQPLRAESGRASIVVPNGRSVDGAIQWKQVGFDMTPQARQLDWTVAYATQFDGERSLRFATTLSTAAGHVAGATQAAAMASFAQRF